MATPSELATMEPQELEDRLSESRRELFNLRFQLATGQLDNSARLGHVRKEVARILTYLRQHDLAIVGAPPAVDQVRTARAGRRQLAGAGSAGQAELPGVAAEDQEET